MPRKNTTKVKYALIASFGGACQRCGYNRCIRALHFHHKDASEKSDWSNNRGNASQDEVAAHPERFMLVCANCHAEIHHKEDQAVKAARATPCKHCGALLAPEPNRVKNGRDTFCSRKCQHAHRPIKAVGLDEQRKRFYRHVEQTDDCWYWTGFHHAADGLGRSYFVHPDGRRQECTAQRLSYIIHYGSIPPRAKVYHTCEKRHCVNPAHLCLRHYSKIEGSV